MALPAYIIVPGQPAANVADTTVSNSWSGTQTLAALTVTGTTTLAAALTGYIKGTSGVVSAQATPIPVADGGTGVGASTGTVAVVLSTSPTLVTPLLGTPTSGNLSNCTALPLTSGVSGILPVANGGTGRTNSPMIFTHFADGSSTHTDGTFDDLYSDTIAAGQFGANGDRLYIEYGGLFVSSATASREIKISFAGTTIFDTGSLTVSLSSAWTAYTSIIRVSATVVRYMVSLTTEGAALAAYTAVGELTGLTLSGTNILKITGAAAGVGAASADIVAKMGSIEFRAA